MNIQNFLEFLQSRSPETKNRIISGVVGVAIIALGSIWITNFSNQIGKSAQTNSGQRGVVLSAVNHFTIEAAEEKDGKTLIYFNVKNESDDILNLSPIDKISLNTGKNNFTPERIQDRQGNEFVRKVLSKSVNYGVLIFPKVEEPSGSLDFDELYMEQSASSLFKESIEIDFEKLEPLEELRS